MKLYKYVTLALAALLIFTIAAMVCLTIPSKEAGAADAHRTRTHHGLVLGTQVL